MYTLYYLPDACSLATQVILHELKQPVNIINMQDVTDFSSINPVGSVPVLLNKKAVNKEAVNSGDVNGQTSHREGAAIILHLLNTHKNTLLPTQGIKRDRAIENIMFANATMHPAYGRLFFINQYITDEAAKKEAYQAATAAINGLWQVVETQLATQPYLGGESLSAADILLSVYARWGGSFPVDIQLGSHTQKMLTSIQSMPSFMKALAAEQDQAAA